MRISRAWRRARQSVSCVYAHALLLGRLFAHRHREYPSDVPNSPFTTTGSVRPTTPAAYISLSCALAAGPANVEGTLVGHRHATHTDMLRRGAVSSSPSILPHLNRSLCPRVLLQSKTQPTSDGRLPYPYRSAPDATRAISTSVFPCSRTSFFSPSLSLVTISHMATLTARRAHSTQSKGKEPERSTDSHDPQDHSHDPHTHSHSHSHSHSHTFLASFVHIHDHAEEGHAKDAEQIVQALKGEGTSCSILFTAHFHSTPIHGLSRIRNHLNTHPTPAAKAWGASSDLV